MGISGDNNSLLSKIVVIRHGTLVIQSNRAIENREIAETKGRPHAILENQEITVVERDESNLTLTVEAPKVQLATLLDHLNANGPTDPSQAHAVPSPPTSERRVLVASAHRTLDVRVVAAETTRTQPLKIESQAPKFLPRSLL